MEADHIGPDTELYLYLRALGYSDPQIAEMNTNTRLFHDLGLYGDAAEDAMWLLQRRFGVDLSELDINKYFPPEFEGKNRLDAFLRNIAYPRDSRLIDALRVCEPLTLSMVGRSLAAKRWSL